jgi:hypothetical protein
MEPPPAAFMNGRQCLVRSAWPLMFTCERGSLRVSAHGPPYARARTGERSEPDRCGAVPVLSCGVLHRVEDKESRVVDQYMDVRAEMLLALFLCRVRTPSQTARGQARSSLGRAGTARTSALTMDASDSMSEFTHSATLLTSCAALVGDASRRLSAASAPRLCQALDRLDEGERFVAIGARQKQDSGALLDEADSDALPRPARSARSVGSGDAHASQHLAKAARSAGDHAHLARQPRLAGHMPFKCAWIACPCGPRWPHRRANPLSSVAWAPTPFLLSTSRLYTLTIPLKPAGWSFETHGVGRVQTRKSRFNWRCVCGSCREGSEGGGCGRAHALRHAPRSPGVPPPPRSKVPSHSSPKMMQNMRMGVPNLFKSGTKHFTGANPRPKPAGAQRARTRGPHALHGRCGAGSHGGAG